MGQIPVGEQQTVGQNTRQIYDTRAGFPECVVSTMRGPLPGITQEITQTKDIPRPRREINISDPSGNLTRPTELDDRNSMDYATTTPTCIFFLPLFFTIPNVGDKPQIPMGQIPVGEQQTVDQNTRYECMVRTMPGPPPETTQDRTQRKNPVPGWRLKFLALSGIEPGHRIGKQELYRPRHGDTYLYLG